jgi:hypothetical protein
LIKAKSRRDDLVPELMGGFIERCLSCLAQVNVHGPGQNSVHDTKPARILIKQPAYDTVLITSARNLSSVECVSCRGFLSPTDKYMCTVVRAIQPARM